MMVIFAAVVAVELVGKYGGERRGGEWRLDDFRTAISAMIVLNWDRNHWSLESAILSCLSRVALLRTVS